MKKIHADDDQHRRRVQGYAKRLKDYPEKVQEIYHTALQLLEWNRAMGCFEAPCWGNLENWITEFQDEMDEQEVIDHG